MRLQRTIGRKIACSGIGLHGADEPAVRCSVGVRRGCRVRHGPTGTRLAGHQVDHIECCIAVERMLIMAHGDTVSERDLPEEIRVGSFGNVLTLLTPLPP